MGYNLTDKISIGKNLSHFCQKIFNHFLFAKLIYVHKNNSLPTLIFHNYWSSKVQINLEKNIERGNNSEEKVLDSHIRYHMPKFECSRLNGVAVIAKT